MSTLEEIKQAVVALPEEQRRELDAFIWGTMRNVRVTYSDTVDKKMAEMDAGATVPWSELRKEMLAHEDE